MRAPPIWPWYPTSVLVTGFDIIFFTGCADDDAGRGPGGHQASDENRKEKAWMPSPM